MQSQDAAYLFVFKTHTPKNCDMKNSLIFSLFSLLKVKCIVYSSVICLLNLPLEIRELTKIVSMVQPYESLLAFFKHFVLL